MKKIHSLAWKSDMQNKLDGINIELYNRVREIGRNMIIETLSNPTTYLRTVSDYQVFDSLVKTVRDEQLQTQWNNIRERTKVRIYVADYRRKLKNIEDSST